MLSQYFKSQEFEQSDKAYENWGLTTQTTQTMKNAIQ